MIHSKKTLRRYSQTVGNPNHHVHGNILFLALDGDDVGARQACGFSKLFLRPTGFLP
jgi:hypothetical protein